ncbi:MAG: hypothetical protein WCC36_11455 [Gammaproteobacteria bacterium]
MDDIDHSKVERCVEQLCNDGCQAVWGYIEALETGRDLPQASELNGAERQYLLAELQAIMAVYERR